MDQWELDGERERESDGEIRFCVWREWMRGTTSTSSTTTTNVHLTAQMKKNKKEKLYNLQQPPLTHPSLSTDQLTPPLSRICFCSIIFNRPPPPLLPLGPLGIKYCACWNSPKWRKAVSDVTTVARCSQMTPAKMAKIWTICSQR